MNRFASLLFGAALALAVRNPSNAQIPAALAQQACDSPIASMLPECQARAGGSSEARLPTAHAGQAANPLSSAEISNPHPGADAPTVLPRPAKRPSPTAPATEFQRFAASSLGEVLPVFGLDLFSDVPTTFAPVDRAPVTADYLIGPGDELMLRVWGQVNLNLALTVDRAGEIYVPQVGNLRVAGLNYADLVGFLRSHLGRVFRNFDLNVTMGQLRSIQIFVVGHARQPGGYTVSAMSTLLNAIFACGGPSPQGSMRHIQLKRGADVVSEMDLYEMLIRGDKSRDVRLQPGDVVHIPPATSQIALGGSVRKAAIYELKQTASLAAAIELAGGLSAMADNERIIFERIEDGGVRQIREVSLSRDGATATVRDGDVIRVRTINPRFAHAVTLRGNVANSGRFPWHAGMRLRDLLPEKEALITRDYWRRRNTIGLQSRDDMALDTAGSESVREPDVTRIELNAPEINWTYAVVERRDPKDLSTRLLPFHPGKLVLEGDETQNMELQSGDIVSIFSQSDIKVPLSQQSRFVRLEGEFRMPGVFSIKPGETLQDVIARAGGLTAHAYPFGSEFSRRSAREEQQRRINDFVHDLETDIDRTGRSELMLASSPMRIEEVSTRLSYERNVAQKLRKTRASGRIVLSVQPEHTTLASAANLELEDGDRLYVPPRPAVVHVLGAVYNANTFVFTKDHTVGVHLRNAGGPTRYADQKKMFIIRADGTVLSRSDKHGLAGKSFSETVMNPGDAIVVPEHILKGSVGRTFRDWAQVTSQFALGAASVNVLRR